MKQITIYIRDNKEISKDEWDKFFKKDLEKEEEKYKWSIRDSVFSDLDNGCLVDLNGHDYEMKTNTFYNNAKELLSDMLEDGHYDEIIDAIKKLSEEETFLLVSKMSCVVIQKDNKQLMLKDESDW